MCVGDNDTTLFIAHLGNCVARGEPEAIANPTVKMSEVLMIA